MGVLDNFEKSTVYCKCGRFIYAETNLKYKFSRATQIVYDKEEAAFKCKCKCGEITEIKVK